jgi:hypothetical protein
MTQPSSPEPSPKAAYRPTCPFCAAPWTDAMLAHLEAISRDPSCACCGGLAWPIHPPEPREPPPRLGDLCCSACGEAIYRQV